MVGFILMKVGSFNHSVRPPKTPTITAVTRGSMGTRRATAKDRASARHVARPSPEDAPAKVHARLQKKQSILDVVKLNGNGMKRTLSKDDQEKLDEYFTGVRQVESGLELEGVEPIVWWMVHPQCVAGA